MKTCYTGYSPTTVVSTAWIDVHQESPEGECKNSVSRRIRIKCSSSSFMLLLLSSLKLITEIALLALIGQGLVGLLAGPQREANPFYRLLQAVGRPFVVMARWISPRVVLDRHVPLVAFLGLALAWLLLTSAKIAHCVSIGIEACR